MNDQALAPSLFRTRPRRRRWVVAASAAVAVAVAVVLLAWVVFHKKPVPPAKPAAVSVSAVAVVMQDVPVSVTTLGAAQAWTSDTILAQVSGILRSVDFVEGTDVKAGQLLAQIDPTPYQAALTQAQGTLQRDQALLAGARVDLARYATLVKQDSIANQTYADEAALVKQDEGTVLLDQGIVASAQVNLNWCRITSPIDGRVGVRSVDPGNYVTTGATSNTTSTTGSTTGPVGIVIVNQIEPIAVIFSIPQGDYQRLAKASNGFRTPLATEAISQDTGASLGTGELSIADNRVDPTTGTVKMKARFANTADLLLPGQFVNVRLTLQTLSKAITIPAAAVNVGPNGTFAYVVGANQTVSVQPIKVDETEGTTAVVTSGLTSGQTVVTDGQMTLTAGSTVKVVPPAPATPPTEPGQPAAAAQPAAAPLPGQPAQPAPQAQQPAK
ncbi:efflux RND transporter periplasmic adaptor subunit [Acidisphaera sp. S103]|uniref:efflux RND transporter periplasmic adaptor subunit n=1 Tax=Acidisphaera sp. S103 TaxID=1747223 RepID=UPI00131C1536|nr:efflux RND transporter periplasmic adaptor subunit [Acidisphaera sp. S103]